MKQLLSVAFAIVALVAPTYAGTLTLQQPGGFALLGVSCGGTHVSTFATDFQTDEDGATTGIVGDVYVWTRCGGSGRAGGYASRLYSRWVLAAWDLSGNLLATYPWPADADKPASAYDEYLATSEEQSDEAGNTLWTAQVTTSFGPAYVARLHASDRLFEVSPTP